MNLKKMLVAGVVSLLLAAPGRAQDEPDVRLFFEAGSRDEDVSKKALEEIGNNWKDSYAVMLIERVRILPSGVQRGVGPIESEQFVDPEAGGGDTGRADPLRSRGPSRFASRRDPMVQTRERILGFLKDKTGQDFDDDWDAWRLWAWDRQYDPHPQLAGFKTNLYALLSRDQTFLNFMQGTAAVRLDEVEWGGVPVNGIPPLDHPAVVSAGDARHMDDGDIVFGTFAGGEARAYPKKILGWHELAWDNVGGEELTIVYCTLCGTAIPYKSTVGGRVVKFGTSGLLYRSNKLLFDDITFTLWSSLTGEPVIGRAVGSGMRLEPMAMVTTTWGDWKEMHPDTTVLSQDTGFERDYSEGAAYAEYFSNDDLMFVVSTQDDRLANKDEVLVMRQNPEQGTAAIAITADFLARNRVYETDFGGRRLVVLTSADGANRVFEAGGTSFTEMAGGDAVRDAGGTTWKITEDQLVREDGSGAPLARVPAFRAFWFGWYAQYPETELIGR